jgi:hypothetical protein
MALVSVAILPVSLGILAITGLWEHHVQILYIATLISIAAVAPLFELAARKAPVLTLLTVILCACVLGGPVTLNRYLSSIKNFRSTLAQMSTLPPEARQVLAVGDPELMPGLGRMTISVTRSVCATGTSLVRASTSIHFCRKSCSMKFATVRLRPPY